MEPDSPKCPTGPFPEGFQMPAEAEGSDAIHCQLTVTLEMDRMVPPAFASCVPSREQLKLGLLSHASLVHFLHALLAC